MRASSAATAAVFIMRVLAVLLATTVAAVAVSPASAQSAGYVPSMVVEDTINTFKPAPGSPPNFFAEWEKRADVMRLADYKIQEGNRELDSPLTDHIYARGKVEAGHGLIESMRRQMSNGDYEKLKDFAHDTALKAAELASKGQLSDWAQLQDVFQFVLPFVRRDQLTGNNDEESEALNDQIMEVFSKYSKAVSKKCLDQTYKQELAVNLARMNEFLGTGIDVTGCIKPDLAIVRAWLVEFEVAIREDAKASRMQEDAPQEGGDISESSRKIDDVLKGTARLQVKAPIGSGIIWTNAQSRDVQLDVTMDDLQSKYEKSGGEGDSWQAVRRSMHLQGKGQGNVQGEAAVESHADGTYNIRIPAAARVAGQSTTVEKEEWSQSETGFGTKDDQPPDENRSSQVAFVTFPGVTVPGLLENGQVHHGANLRPDVHDAVAGEVTFDSGWVAVQPSDGPPIQVHVSYTLTPQ